MQHSAIKQWGQLPSDGHTERAFPSDLTHCLLAFIVLRVSAATPRGLQLCGLDW